MLNLTKQEREKRLAYLLPQMRIMELRAHYWMALATTGAATRRKLSRNGVELTDQEKIDDALQTANQHISNLQDCLDTLGELQLD